jgi:AICAR transformylase/IMP cyclohydrolase PurH
MKIVPMFKSALPEISIPVKVENVLIRVSDTIGLDDLVVRMLEINPEVVFYAFEQNYEYIKNTLKDRITDKNLCRVKDFTNFYELQNFYIQNRKKALRFDLYVINFSTIDDSIDELNSSGVISKLKLVTSGYDLRVAYKGFEEIIDVFGITITKSLADKYNSCTVLSYPVYYNRFCFELDNNKGFIILETRLDLMISALKQIAEYELLLNEYLEKKEKNIQKLAVY